MCVVFFKQKNLKKNNKNFDKKTRRARIVNQHNIHTTYYTILFLVFHKFLYILFIKQKTNTRLVLYSPPFKQLTNRTKKNNEEKNGKFKKTEKNKFEFKSF